MPNPPNPITNRSTCVAQTQTYFIFESEDIRESQIFHLLALYSKDMPVFIWELLTEQLYWAIKRFKDSTIRPLLDIHIYLPVKNLDSLPDFLLLLLMKYKNCENNLVIHTLDYEFSKTLGFIQRIIFGKYPGDHAYKHREDFLFFY